MVLRGGTPSLCPAVVVTCPPAGDTPVSARAYAGSRWVVGVVARHCWNYAYCMTVMHTAEPHVGSRSITCWVERHRKDFFGLVTADGFTEVHINPDCATPTSLYAPVQHRALTEVLLSEGVEVWPQVCGCVWDRLNHHTQQVTPAGVCA